MSWIWQGRQLVKAEKDKKISFTYDSEGVRTSKTVGSTTTKYLLNGTQILAQTTNDTTLSFFYDQQGNRVAMADSGNHFYYYIYNLQGDVIALADASTGKLVVTYTYDAWGKPVSVTDTTSNSVGTLNPFRYRGYYYDTETKLYYLQTRYYDPDTGRFVNADTYATTNTSDALSTNMFAYCENNPVMGHDPSGENILFAFVGGISGGLTSYLAGDSLFEVILSTATGALSGYFGGDIAFAINIFDAFLTTAKLWASGAGFLEGLGWGAASFLTSFVSGDDVSKLFGVGIADETKAFFDLTVGITVSVAATSAEQSSTKNAPKRSSKKTIKDPTKRTHKKQETRGKKTGGKQSSPYETVVSTSNGRTVKIYCHAYL